MYFFFFQAEDGIRDVAVTGVQTCALPIYFAAAAVFFHSLFTAPALRNNPIDWLDGGKLFVESCFLLIAATSLLRWRHSRQKAAHQRRLSPQTAASTEPL